MRSYGRSRKRQKEYRTSPRKHPSTTPSPKHRVTQKHTQSSLPRKRGKGMELRDSQPQQQTFTERTGGASIYNVDRFSFSLVKTLHIGTFSFGAIDDDFSVQEHMHGCLWDTYGMDVQRSVHAAKVAQGQIPTFVCLLFPLSVCMRACTCDCTLPLASLFTRLALVRNSTVSSLSLRFLHRSPIRTRFCRPLLSPIKVDNADWIPTAPAELVHGLLASPSAFLCYFYRECVRMRACGVRVCAWGG